MGTILKCKGLKTFDNELSNTEGYLTKAENIVIDTPDVGEPRRGLAKYGDSLPSSSDRLKQVLVYKDRLLRHFGTTLQFDDSTGAFTGFSEAITEPEGTARIKGKESNGNFYFTSNSGIMKISAKSASEITASSIENAGGPKALDLDGNLVFTSAGFLPANSKTAYRVVWGKKDNNGNVILGAPSARLVVTNNTSDVNLAEQISITTLDKATTPDGSYILLSTTTTDYVIYADKTGSTPAPTASDTFGKTKIAVDISGATTASDVAVLFAEQIALLAFSVTINSNIITAVSTEAGEDLTNASDSAVTPTGFTVSVEQQGQVVTGTAANVELTFTIPSEVTTSDYFYQIYRTGVVTVPEGLTLDDIEPGDDHNFLFEDFPSSAELTAKEITITDFTPESFREQGAFLYTNPTTGEGILQANEKPPVAKDIELFKQFMFYANTSTFHRLTLRLLSVDDFVSGTSGIVVGNGSAAREYFFIGQTQVQDVTAVADVADSLDGKYFLINSARNERKYYVWFSTGAGALDPAVTGRLGIKVTITTGDSASDVALAMSAALLASGDFSTSIASAVVTVTWNKNGYVDDAVDSGTPTGFTFSVPSTDGLGEDASNNQVLLSSLSSVGQAIDETARSLVKVINKDTSSPVRATYLSSPDDLPGIISLESKDLEDDSFFLGSLDSLGAEYDPTLSQTHIITAISVASSTQITSATHGLTSGDEIYIYDTDSTPAILGKYVVTVVNPNNFTIPVTVTSVGANGTWFLADVESDNEVAPNRLYYSKFQQPEAVPLLNYIDIGPKDKAIQRILALRDNLIVMKEDGIYLVTGTSSPFSDRLVDSSVQVLAPDTAVILNNQIYALTTQGIATITDSSPYVISTDIEDRILGIANPRHDYKLTSFAVSYESERSYLLALPSVTSDTSATQIYRYNYFTGAWTRWTIGGTCGVVNKGDDKLYLGDNENNFMRQERKNDNRTDYADLEYTLSIPSASVGDEQITLSNASTLSVGDVIYQLQTVTIFRFNSLLLRLDIDAGLDDTDYYSTLVASAGDNITNKMDALNIKLVADDSSGIITATTYSTDWTTLLSEFNTLISELNDASSDTAIKTYTSYSDTVAYEVIVTAIPFSGNTVSVSQNVPFLQGSVIIFEGIPVDVEWSPQHFGDAQLTKQVRDATLIFDQTNFYSGTIGFKSDISQSYEFSNFLARGVGDFGYANFAQSNFGGLGSESPIRRIVPLAKQRCRHLRIRFQHNNARETFKIVGITMNPRSISARGYR